MQDTLSIARGRGLQDFARLLSPHIDFKSIIGTGLSSGVGIDWRNTHENLLTTGTGTFGKIVVDNLTLDGATIVSDTGTISFGDDNLTTTSYYEGVGAGVGTSFILSKVTGDANYRFDVDVDGGIGWGSGAAVWDTNLYRAGTNHLRTSDWFTCTGFTCDNISIDVATITSDTGAISFSNETLTTTTTVTASTLTIGGGSITDATNAISFGNEALTTTGNMTAANFITAGNVDGVDVSAFKTSYDAHVGSGGAAHADVIAAGADGFMTGADKTKLDGIEAGADVTDATNVGAVMSDAVHGTRGGGTLHADVVAGVSDGFMTSAMATKLAGIETGATTDQTANEILTAIKTVDGAGSGLDADLLDNNSTVYFLNVANMAAGQLALARGGTASDTSAWANKLIKFNSGASSISITAAGEAIIDDADAAAQRTTLGLGTIATQAANNVNITGGAINATTIGSATRSSGRFSNIAATTYINAEGEFQHNGTPGIDTTFLDFDGNTITVLGGIITSKI